MRHFGQSTSGNSAGLWMAAELEHAAAPPLNWLPLIWETAGGKGTGQKQAGVSRGQSTATRGNGVREKREKNGGRRMGAPLFVSCQRRCQRPGARADVANRRAATSNRRTAVSSRVLGFVAGERGRTREGQRRTVRTPASILIALST